MQQMPVNNAMICCHMADFWDMQKYRPSEKTNSVSSVVIFTRVSQSNFSSIFLCRPFYYPLSPISLLLPNSPYESGCGKHHSKVFINIEAVEDDGRNLRT
jgi:hypothetical protein